MAADPELIDFTAPSDSDSMTFESEGNQDALFAHALTRIDAALQGTPLTPVPGVAHLVVGRTNEARVEARPSLLPESAASPSVRLDLGRVAPPLARRAMVWIGSTLLLGSLAGSSIATAVALAWIV